MTRKEIEETWKKSNSGLKSMKVLGILYGHLVLDTDDFVEGVTYPKDQLEDLFDKDFNTACEEANKLIGEIPLNHTAKGVIIEMVFQLGRPRCSKFKKMWQALRDGDYDEAANQMIDSAWHKQTTKRCESLAAAMRSSNQ